VRPAWPPHPQGATHPAELRRARLPRIARDAPIPSVRDFVRAHFPSIAVLYARLGARGPAGLTFGDRQRGPTIVLNLEGKNENPLVRRFALGHELYHVLVDWTGHEPLVTISGYLHDAGLDRERRANAFAARLLCPESKVHKLRRGISAEEAARKLGPFGLSYSALRLYLHNEANLELPRSPTGSFVGLGTEVEWSLAEEPIGVANFPLAEVPPERRTDVARVAAELHSSGRLSRDAFASALGVTPASDLERVLAFFELDAPSDE
jgi:Zn-dependent peptidase ImmA (M78 family)